MAVRRLWSLLVQGRSSEAWATMHWGEIQDSASLHAGYKLGGLFVSLGIAVINTQVSSTQFLVRCTEIPAFIRV